MPRPRTGSVRRKKTRQGTSYGLRLFWRGERIYHHLGGSWEGWTEERVERERGYIAAQLERGEYVPQMAPAAPRPVAEGVPNFQVFASTMLARWRRRLAPKTAQDLEWRLRTAMDHFGAMALDEIDASAADEFVDWALRERDMIREAEKAGTPIMDPYVDARTGRTHERRRRGLSNSSINKVLVAVKRVLKEAVRQGLIERNPLTDPDCFLREARGDPSCSSPRSTRRSPRAGVGAGASRFEVARRAGDPRIRRIGRGARATPRGVGHARAENPSRRSVGGSTGAAPQ
jgi:hypothetical protein